jgi:iron complex outermembrane receptor protein
VTANPLQPQIARSIELSHSLRTEFFATQFNAYANHLSGEILRGRASSGADWALNAPATRHLGLEAMLSTLLVSAGGTWRGSVSGRLTDARFHEHPIHGNGPIAGVPQSEFQTMLRWSSGSGKLSVGAAINWLPEGMQVDNADTDTAPGYTLLHLDLRWAIAPDWELTAGCRNVMDRNHVAAVIVRERVAAPIQANYLPGTGRKVSLSIRREW